MFDSVRFMASLFSSLVDNLAEDLQCKSLEYMTDKDLLLNSKCVDCNKTFQRDSKTRITSVMEISTSFVSCAKKILIYFNIYP